MSKIDPNKLLISSDFYSVQGEGLSSGVPSYFIRLGICNLTCGMSNKFLNKLTKDKLLEDGEIFEGDLVTEGKATWTCDSVSQWAFRGVEQEFSYIKDQWIKQGLYEDIKSGIIHVILTGGEPTIIKHQESIINFDNWLCGQDEDIVWAFYEIETNGTVVIKDELFEILAQINCSPKLSNSGLSMKQRINPDAINKILDHDNYQFKFVVSTEKDITEMFDDFIKPFNIPLDRVVCMPGMDSQDQFFERTQWVMEMAKKYRFIGLTRLHIAAWDKTLNV